MQTLLILVAALGAVLLVKLLLRAMSNPGSAKRKALARIPDTIHLAQAGTDAWADAITARRLATELSRRGFDDAGTFQAPELRDTTIELMVNPAERILAALHEHRENGFWVELAIRFVDGTSYQVTSSHEAELSGQPGHKRVRLPGATPDMLHKRLDSGRPEGEAEKITAAEAVARYEGHYAETAAWRKAQGAGGAEAAEANGRQAA